MLIRTKKPQHDGRGTIREQVRPAFGAFNEARFLLC
jgi:hypothetical protein